MNDNSTIIETHISIRRKHQPVVTVPRLYSCVEVIQVARSLATRPGICGSSSLKRLYLTPL